MAENVTLARPYAEAVFALARENGALEAWSAVLERLSVIAADPQVLACLGNPSLKQAQVIQLLLESAGVSDSAEQANFVRMLVENSRAQVLPEIAELFKTLKSAHDSIKDAVVTSAFALDDAALARLTADIEAHFKSKVRVSVVIDPELIGGVRIAVGDEVIDASVRGKLAAMTAALQN